MNCGSFRIPVLYINFNKNILYGLLRIGYTNIKILILIEHSCVQYFVFRLGTAPLRIFISQLIVWEFLLRVFIQILHIVVRRKIIEIIIQFLYILTMIALVVTETK